MEDRTFSRFDLILARHVIKSMIFSIDITTLAPCCYFHHQTTRHYHHKLMISTCPPLKKLAHNFEVFFPKFDII